MIFLFLLNLDSKSIAEIINRIDRIENKTISRNTIDQIFTTQLMPNFAAYGRKALHIKLVQLIYYRFIPRNILCNDFAIEITDYVIFN